MGLQGFACISDRITIHRVLSHMLSSKASPKIVGIMGRQNGGAEQGLFFKRLMLGVGGGQACNVLNRELHEF